MRHTWPCFRFLQGLIDLERHHHEDVANNGDKRKRSSEKDNYDDLKEPKRGEVRAVKLCCCHAPLTTTQSSAFQHR
ncbi:hypothetical protein EYF80_026887 [Liparis tanakae]|uniref:Uncharacterized protein n=1 Tax=Liparis tanakae TaxID=230148 RepID=A0A4Z2HDD7_9TELE|nr:hypothetical protein EYF80_026887 [Liparis tanakae]